MTAYSSLLAAAEVGGMATHSQWPAFNAAQSEQVVVRTRDPDPVVGLRLQQVIADVVLLHACPDCSAVVPYASAGGRPSPNEASLWQPPRVRRPPECRTRSLPHDGRSVTHEGFRKRVAYLDVETIGSHRVGRAVDHPSWRDPALRTAVHHLHEALRHPGDAFEAEGRLRSVTERLAAHLDQRQEPTTRRDPGLARRLRDLLDSHVVEGISLADAATLLEASPTHLVRAFRNETSMPPHRYLTGRRLDRARKLLLEGHRAAEVAIATGFHDQAHLTRHFRRMLGVTPGVYAASSKPRSPLGLAS